MAKKENGKKILNGGAERRTIKPDVDTPRPSIKGPKTPKGKDK